MTETIQFADRSPDYDLVVLGSVEGSKFLSWTLAKQGMRVAVVEQRWIGGSCPNIACLPSKNIIHSAKVASFLARTSDVILEAKVEHVSGDSGESVEITYGQNGSVKALRGSHLRAAIRACVNIIWRGMLQRSRRSLSQRLLQRGCPDDGHTFKSIGESR